MAIQHYVPFSAKMRASFVIDEGRIHLDRIEFDTDGAKTVATGVVDVRHWPEQTYQFKSRVQFPRMRQLFFKDEKWELAGEGDFTGTFHLFKNGRDLAGTFASAAIGVDEYRFPGLFGSLHWTPTELDVTNAGAQVFGGDARFILLDSAARLARPTHGQVRGEFRRCRPGVVHRLRAAQGTPLRGHRQRRAGAAGMAAGPVRRPPGQRTSGRHAAGRGPDDDRVSRRPVRSPVGRRSRAPRVGAVRTGSASAASADRR